jgi:formylglycine-generating enzyme
MGNVWEWMESPYTSGDYGSRSLRGLRGGSFSTYSNSLSSSYRGSPDPTFENDNVGFRVASVPEPSTFVLLGMGAIGLSGYAWQRRKRTA